MIIVLGCMNVENPIEGKFGLDCHIHVNNNSGGEMKFNPERAKLAYNSSGIEKACLLPPTFLKRNNPACWGKKECKPDREWVSNTHKWLTENTDTNSIAFCGLDPSYPWWKEELKHCSDLGMKGLKLHTVGAGYSLLDSETYKKLDEISKESARLGMKVLIHSRFKTKKEANKLLSLVKENSETTFILGHMLGHHYELLKELKLKNAYLEISGAIFWFKTEEEKKSVVKVWRNFGIERVIFGSDWPVFHPQETLFELKKYPLSVKEFNMILKTNSNKLF